MPTYTDAFTAADGTTLTAYSANWANAMGSFAITSNAIRTNVADADCLAYHNGALNNNQWCEVRIAAIAAGGNYQNRGAACRASNTGGGAAYVFIFDDQTSSFTLGSFVAGSFTELGSGSASPAVNDIVRVNASGTSISGLRNGATLAGPVTDSSITSGTGGVSGYSVATVDTGVRIDDWLASDGIGAGFPFRSQPMAHMLVR